MQALQNEKHINTEVNVIAGLTKREYFAGRNAGASGEQGEDVNEDLQHSYNYFNETIKKMLAI